MKTKFTRVVFAGFIMLCVPLTTFAVSSQVPGTPSVEDLFQQIKMLQLQIAQLTDELATTKKEVAVIKEELRITKTLKFGMTDEEVKKLQEFLSTMPDIYPEGLVTGYFGSLTERAVRKWQEKNALEGVGIVGPKTRARLAEITAGYSSDAANVSRSPLVAIISSVDGAIGGPGSTMSPGLENRAQNRPTTTSSGVVPAIPATPATPTSTSGVATVPAVPATPAQSATQDIAPPSVPTNLLATASTTQIALSWSASTDNIGVAGYKIFRNGAQIATTAYTSFADTGLTSSTTYTYSVSSYDMAGNNSAQSSSVSATTQGTFSPVDTTPPEIIQVAHTNTTDTSTTITWSTNETATGLITIKIGPFGVDSTGRDIVALSNGNSFSVFVDQLTAETEYYVRVKLSDLSGNESIAYYNFSTLATPSTVVVTAVGSAMGSSYAIPSFSCNGGNYLLAVSQVQGGVHSIGGASYGGSPLSKIAGTADQGFGELWVLQNPPSGAHDLVFNYANNSDPLRTGTMAICVSGAQSLGAGLSATAWPGGTSGSLQDSSAKANDMMVGFYWEGVNAEISFPMETVFAHIHPYNNMWGIYKSGATSLSWTADKPAYYGFVAVNVVGTATP